MLIIMWGKPQAPTPGFIRVLEVAVTNKTYEKNSPYSRSRKRRQLQGARRIGRLVDTIEGESGMRLAGEGWTMRSREGR